MSPPLVRGADGQFKICDCHACKWWEARRAFDGRMKNLAVYDDTCRAGHAADGHYAPQERAARGEGREWSLAPRSSLLTALFRLTRMLWRLLVKQLKPPASRQEVCVK
jgi:hypothetical protein